MSGDDVIQLIDQIWSLEHGVCDSLLKVRDHKHLILIVITAPIFMKIFHQPCTMILNALSQDEKCGLSKEQYRI